jgi:predicted MFS family arabinose efflux permease
MSGLKRSQTYYVLGLLVAGYALNSFDRSILGILLEPIRLEFGLRDTQLGLLGGVAFAALYCTFGVPLALWADRASRRNVLAFSVLLWSVMTVFCGLAVGFLTLLLARAGTAIGEAGGSPASQSMISDYFPPERRATALGIFALGAPAGSMLAALLGGLGNETLGWRATFILAGIPGLLLAPLLLLTVREPLRVDALAHGPPAACSGSSPPIRVVAATLLRQSSFRNLCLACALHAFAMYGAATFTAAFLIRSHGWNTVAAGQLLAVIGAFGLAGTYVGGWLADRLARERRDARWGLWVPALASAILVPLRFVAYLSDDVQLAVATLAATGFFGTMFFGPSFAASQALAAPRMRATAAATLTFVKTMLGLGLGPLLVGMTSDYLAPAAQSHSLRYALLLLVVADLLAALLFAVAAKSFRGDLNALPSAPGLMSEPLPDAASPARQ